MALFVLWKRADILFSPLGSGHLCSWLVQPKIKCYHHLLKMLLNDWLIPWNTNFEQHTGRFSMQLQWMENIELKKTRQKHNESIIKVVRVIYIPSLLMPNNSSVLGPLLWYFMMFSVLFEAWMLLSAFFVIVWKWATSTLFKSSPPVR